MSRVTRLRHFYSDMIMAGVCTDIPLPTDYPRSIAYYHARFHSLDVSFCGNYRDARVPQIQYIAQLHCERCGLYWERCRCVDNITRLSAWCPPCDTLEPDQIVRISCVELVPRTDGRTTTPVYRHGVVSVEQRAEFIVHTIRHSPVPQPARRPRLYQSFRGIDLEGNVVNTFFFLQKAKL